MQRLVEAGCILEHGIHSGYQATVSSIQGLIEDGCLLEHIVHSGY
jgi:hypothetical protein